MMFPLRPPYECIQMCENIVIQTSHYIALHYIALHCISSHCITLHYTTLHCIALHCIPSHCFALHCIALHYIALHYIALHLHIYITKYSYIYIYTCTCISIYTVYIHTSYIYICVCITGFLIATLDYQSILKVLCSVAQWDRWLNMVKINKPCWLVVSTPLKNISQLDWLFPIYGKTKHVPNHQPAW